MPELTEFAAKRKKMTTISVPFSVPRGISATSSKSGPKSSAASGKFGKRVGAAQSHRPSSASRQQQPKSQTPSFGRGRSQGRGQSSSHRGSSGSGRGRMVSRP